MISVICTTGSRAINSQLRADLLWRMVNSMHDRPGWPLELILVDNCHGPGPHRRAIDDIFDCYETVTHIIRNRENEYHGGGVNQGVALADGDLIVQTTDDLEWRPDWLFDLVYPLYHGDESEGLYPKLIAAPMKGHNARSKLLGEKSLGNGKIYQFRSNAAAYCWAFWRKDYERIGRWRRAHFADTNWSQRAQSLGYCFVLPTWSIARETNLNYLRPWDYRAEKHLEAGGTKSRRIGRVFEEKSFTTRSPKTPDAEYPLRNPKDIGPGAYPEDWLREQGVDPDAT